MAKTVKKYSKNPKYKKKRLFTNKHYKSGDGMMTSIWGPGMWHYLHTVSFNYPVSPTDQQKKHYKNLIFNMQHTLPCKYCRKNLKKNLAQYPLLPCHQKNRTTFSKYIYKLHEIINKMLGKTSGLSYCDVRERYEHFRSRCITNKKNKIYRIKKTRKKKESGCVEPLYGKKSKCIISIVPNCSRKKTFNIDKKCIITK